jgi:predicted aminopeptidase
MEQARPHVRWYRRALRVIAWALAGVAGLAVAYLVLAPTGRYIARAAWEEAKILVRRRPIPELVEDNRTPESVRAKLRLVLAARGFAEDSVGLRAGDSFTTYSRLDRDTLVLVLSGAYRDRLERYTWWFPIVGRVPYKGFFDFSSARRSSRELERRGFDTYLRSAAAFSTLGFFNDPLLSTTLRQDSLDLANTVIHEITHATFYARGEAVFNESFANFVGARGAAEFFRARGRPAAAAEVDARWSDQKLLARFWGALHRTLDSTFKAHPGPALKVRRLALRDSIFGAARRQLLHQLGPQLRTISPRALERTRFDNAALLARRIYLTDLDLFDAVYERERRDLRATVRRIIELARSEPDDPYGALRRWLDAVWPAVVGASSQAHKPGRLPPNRPRSKLRRSNPIGCGASSRTGASSSATTTRCM